MFLSVGKGLKEIFDFLFQGMEQEGIGLGGFLSPMESPFFSLCSFSI